MENKEFKAKYISLLEEDVNGLSAENRMRIWIRKTANGHC
jgi:hypothetical protein